MENYNVDQIHKSSKPPEGSPYYGQWETDKVIESYFKGMEYGSAIEIGAADGVRGSNTLYFEKRGWDVLCIEPNPGYRKSLGDNRNYFLTYAAGKKIATKKFTIFEVGEDNIMSSLSSLKPDKRLVRDHEHIINKKRKIEVPVRPMSYVLWHETYGTPFFTKTYYDFVSIDTEGTELDVLKGWPFEMIYVELFVIENNYSNPKIEKYMNEQGYILDQRYHINDFYIKDEN